MNYALKHAEENMPVQNLSFIKSGSGFNCFQASNFQIASIIVILISPFSAVP